VYWHIKTQLASGPVAEDLTTTVVNNYKLLINDVTPVHSEDSFIIKTQTIHT